MAKESNLPLWFVKICLVCYILLLIEAHSKFLIIFTTCMIILYIKIIIDIVENNK